MENLTIDALLNRVREAQSLKSDYQLHKALGFSAQTIGHWRHGRSLPDEKACQKLALAAGLDPDVVIAQVHALRTKDSAARAIWERIAERLQMAAHGAAAAIFAVVIAMGFVAGDARAASAGDVHASESLDSKVYTSHLFGWALLFAVLAWLVSRFDPGFTPCFVPAE